MENVQKFGDIQQIQEQQQEQYQQQVRQDIHLMDGIQRQVKEQKY